MEIAPGHHPTGRDDSGKYYRHPKDRYFIDVVMIEIF